jgi:hypothetical protein
MRFGVLFASLILTGCQPATVINAPSANSGESDQARKELDSRRFSTEGPAAIEGRDLTGPFDKIVPGMSYDDVRRLMGVKPARSTDGLWEYEGGFAAGEPFPVRNVYRIMFADGVVAKKQRTISDCIYQVPGEDR